MGSIASYLVSNVLIMMHTISTRLHLDMSVISLIIATYSTRGHGIYYG